MGAYIKYQPYIYNGSNWVEYDGYIYNGSSWVKYDTYIYSNNTSSRTYLYYNGDDAETGGAWTAEGRALSGINYSREPIFTQYLKKMVIKNDEHAGSGWVYLNQRVDLTNYSQITFVGSVSCNDSSPNCCFLGLWSSRTGALNENLTLQEPLNTVGNNATVTIDISSLNDKYWIGFGIHKNSQTEINITVNEIYLS